MIDIGKPFSLQNRWKMGGIGSGKLVIKSSSLEIHNLLILDNNINTCNIEIRPMGVIVRFEVYWKLMDLLFHILN